MDKDKQLQLREEIAKIRKENCEAFGLPNGAEIDHIIVDPDKFDNCILALFERELSESKWIAERGQDAIDRLYNGRHYLMGVRPEDLTVEDALVALGYNRNGFED